LFQDNIAGSAPDSGGTGIGAAVAAGFAARDLRPAPALLKIVRGLFPGGIADLNMVVYRDRSRRFRHSGRGSLVLDDVRLTFEGGDAALNVHLELLGAEFRRLGKTRADVGFDLRIGGSRPGGGVGARMGGGGGFGISTGLGGARPDSGRKQCDDCDSD